MPQFLYRIQPTRPEMLSASTADEDLIVEKHFAYLKDLRDRGVVLLAGRTLNEDPSSFGIVILEAALEAEARNVMVEDPGVRDGVFRAQLFPYSVALASEKILE
ncbi:MAG: YciI family protein [Candidatus Bipolaricaulia bacterium]